jgi:hypothetical protein
MNGVRGGGGQSEAARAACGVAQQAHGFGYGGVGGSAACVWAGPTLCGRRGARARRAGRGRGCASGPAGGTCTSHRRPHQGTRKLHVRHPRHAPAPETPYTARHAHNLHVGVAPLCMPACAAAAAANPSRWHPWQQLILLGPRGDSRVEDSLVPAVRSTNKVTYPQVLPDPVLATATTSNFAIRYGQHWAWMGDGLRNP